MIETPELIAELPDMAYAPESDLRHPRCEEWDGLSAQELDRLVWSMPTTTIAAQFGVSDSAIGKRCRMAGTKKPPPGFWARVEAGRIPHPNGSPYA